MKIFDIISEGKEKKLSKSTRESMPHAKQFTDIDQYYGMYRFGIAMAGEPEKSSPKEGPAKDVPTVWMYTDAEEDIVNKAAKNQGISGKTIVKKGPSSELKSVNTTSPVAQVKKNKYGV
jgi:hypothetical protein